MCFRLQTTPSDTPPTKDCVVLVSTGESTGRAVFREGRRPLTIDGNADFPLRAVLVVGRGYLASCVCPPSPRRSHSLRGVPVEEMLGGRYWRETRRRPFLFPFWSGDSDSASHLCPMARHPLPTVREVVLPLPSQHRTAHHGPGVIISEQSAVERRVEAAGCDLLLLVKGYTGSFAWGQTFVRQQPKLVGEVFVESILHPYIRRLLRR